MVPGPEFPVTWWLTMHPGSLSVTLKCHVAGNGCYSHARLLTFPVGSGLQAILADGCNSTLLLQYREAYRNSGSDGALQQGYTEPVLTDKKFVSHLKTSIVCYYEQIASDTPYNCPDMLHVRTPPRRSCCSRWCQSIQLWNEKLCQLTGCFIDWREHFVHTNWIGQWSWHCVDPPWVLRMWA